MPAYSVMFMCMPGLKLMCATNEVVTDLDGEYKNADFHLFVELGKAGEGKIKGAEVEVSLLEKSGKSIYNERKRWNAADRELHFKKEVREPFVMECGETKSV